MRVLVCGGRNFGNLNRGPDGNPIRDDDKAREYDFVMDQIEKFAAERSTCLAKGEMLPTDIEIISGLAKGVDSVAVDWAVVNWCQCHTFPADWDTYGRKAGAVRNQQMLDVGKPDVVLAFPGGRGTEHMKKIARKANIEVIECEYS